MNLHNIGALVTAPLTGNWFRAVDPVFYLTALASAHTKVGRTRFNPGNKLPPADQFEVLYLADQYQVAMYEIGAVYGNPVVPGGSVSHPGKSFTMLSVKVSLSNVADLSDLASQSTLNVSAQELTGDWTGYDWRSPMTAVSQPTGIAPTQELGRAMFQAGLEGFCSLSARVPFQKTLTLFPSNFARSSFAEFKDSSGSVVHRVP